MMTKCKNLKKSQPMTPVPIPQRLIAPSAVTNKNKGPITMKCSCHQFVHLLKNLLMFHALYKYSPPLFGPGSSSSDADDLLLSLCKLVAQIITHYPRQEGNTWKLQNFMSCSTSLLCYSSLSCQEL